MVTPGTTARRVTLGADKGYDSADFVAELRSPPCRPKAQPFRYRRPHHPPRRLRPVAEAPKENRGALRLGQDHRRHCPDGAARDRRRARPIHADDGCLQSRPTTSAFGRLKARRPDEQTRQRRSNPPQTHPERKTSRVPDFFSSLLGSDSGPSGPESDFRAFRPMASGRTSWFNQTTLTDRFS